MHAVQAIIMEFVLLNCTGMSEQQQTAEPTLHTILLAIHKHGHQRGKNALVTCLYCHNVHINFSR